MSASAYSGGLDLRVFAVSRRVSRDFRGISGAVVLIFFLGSLIWYLVVLGYILS